MYDASAHDSLATRCYIRCIGGADDYDDDDQDEDEDIDA